MHAGIEMQVLIVSGIRPRTEDCGEVTTGCHPQSVHEIYQDGNIGSLLLYSDTRPSAKTNEAMSIASPLACSLGTRPGLS